MATISKTRLYFAIGVPFEKAWLKKIAAANPKMRVIHTDHDIDKIPMLTDHSHDKEVEHSEEDHHETKAHIQQDSDHQHGSFDPHIWLSPALVKIQARIMLDTLKEIDSAHGNLYEANFQQFIFEIDELDFKLKPDDELSIESYIAKANNIIGQFNPFSGMMNVPFKKEWRFLAPLHDTRSHEYQS